MSHLADQTVVIAQGVTPVHGAIIELDTGGKMLSIGLLVVLYPVAVKYSE
jgi:hypothetical protein